MYRPIDEEIILKNLSKLEEEAKMIYLNKYEPTIHEIRNVYNDIMNFIKEKNRIIYGGFAQNSLIKEKNERDVFYKETDIADVEFYSPDPIGDTIDLVDFLSKKNYKFTEGKEGVHPETYKLFVNFINYCDISYMPKNIYDNCPTIKINGIRFTHPHFMLIDAYRVYSDPMTSYFRLTKTFTRFNKLINYYPLDEDMLYNKLKPSSGLDKQKSEETLEFIRKKIIHDSELVVVGHYAFNQLMKLSNAPETYLIDCYYYQIISTNYSEDIQRIHNMMKNRFPNVVVKKYYPFFQFLDRSTEFFINNTLILRVYDANQRCIVYRKSDKKKVYFGTAQLIFMYNLIQYNISKIRHNEFNTATYGSMLIRQIKARDRYLEENHKTVLDDTIFKEFSMSCIGEPKDLLRESFLTAQKKREQGKQAKFLYKPTGQPGRKPNFRFDNSSGEIIN
jgi:DNA polymerase III epsilon subunit-like protein